MDFTSLFQEFDLQRIIGHYTFSTDVFNVIGNTPGSCVCNGHDSGNGNSVAVKQLHSYSYDTAQVLKAIETFRGLSQHHPNIVRLLHLESVDKSLYMVLEYCPWNLETYCEDKNPDTDEIFELITQCMRAICFLHSQLPQVSRYGYYLREI